MYKFHRRIFPGILQEFPGKFFSPVFPEISLGIFSMILIGKEDQ